MLGRAKVDFQLLPEFRKQNGGGMGKQTSDLVLDQSTGEPGDTVIDGRLRLFHGRLVSSHLL